MSYVQYVLMYICRMFGFFPHSMQTGIQDATYNSTPIQVLSYYLWAGRYLCLAFLYFRYGLIPIVWDTTYSKMVVVIKYLRLIGNFQASLFFTDVLLILFLLELSSDHWIESGMPRLSQPSMASHDKDSKHILELTVETLCPCYSCSMSS